MIQKKDKSLKFKDKKLVFTIQDKTDKSTDDELVFTLNATPGPVAIVYPSLCSPLIRASSDPLIIYVLVDDAFKQMFEFSEKVAKQIVNTYLKFEPWHDYRANQASVDAGLRPAPKDEPLCAKWQDANEQISLKELKADDYGKGYLKNEEEQLFGILHPNAIKWYSSHALKHLFRIEIAPSNAVLQKAANKQLWALSWRVPTAKDKTKFEQYQDQLIQEYNQKYINPSQQRILAYKIGAELTFEEDNASPMQSHHPVYVFDGDYLNLGQLTDVHVSSRQHVFDKTNACVIDGVSEPVGRHVNKAYTPLKNLMDRFGADDDTNLLVFTGDLVDYGRNFDPASAQGRSIKTAGDLWSVMDLDLLKDETLYPKYIDLRIMYSLFLNYYDRYGKPVLLVSGNHEGYTAPYGISPRVKALDGVGGLGRGGVSKTTSGLKSAWNTIAFWKDDGDPHELRDLSDLLTTEKEQREKFIKDSDEAEIQGGTLANEGVPADHNLTMYEACLLYGPDYGRVIMKGSVSKADNTNFNPENYRWFYILFTPVTDLWFSVGKQTIISLNWGEGEKMILYTRLKGILPQSTESLTNDQVDLIRAALKQNAATNVLCSHFTIANYDPSLSYEVKTEAGGYIPRQAPVGVGDMESRDSISDFSTGSFRENRRFLMQECIQKGKIHLTMSGHSHRAGLYQDVGVMLSEPRYVADTHPGMPPQKLPQAEDMKVQSYAPGKDGRYTFPYQADKGLFLVSASGGSIPVQNYRGEMAGFGMAPPSGTLVKFSGGKPDIQVIECNQGSSKPRFCVAMDFLDVLGRKVDEEKQGVFERFECVDSITEKTKQLEIVIQFNKRRFPDVAILKEGKLHIFLDKDGVFVSLPFIVEFKGQQIHIAMMKNNPDCYAGIATFDLISDAINSDANLYFLELGFDGSQLSTMLGYHQYDYASKWYIQMEMKPRGKATATSKNVNDQLAQGFRLERDGVYGTVPSFDWRNKRRPKEYVLPDKYTRKPKKR